MQVSNGGGWTGGGDKGGNKCTDPELLRWRNLGDLVLTDECGVVHTGKTEVPTAMLWLGRQEVQQI